MLTDSAFLNQLLQKREERKARKRNYPSI